MKQPSGLISLYVLPALSLLLYLGMAYYLDRVDTFYLIAGYSILFSIYFYWIITADLSLHRLINWAIFIRIALIPAFPALSDDVYRFIWDGHMILQGTHPFSILPIEYIQDSTSTVLHNLYPKLNSPEYFTIYPPVGQYIFACATWLFPKNLMAASLTIKCFVVFADIGVILLLKNWLLEKAWSRKRVFIYALNPLVILEISGNMHMESIMLFFLLLSVRLIRDRRVFLAGLSMAIAISTKLLPLLLFPGIWKKINTRRFFLLALTSGLASLLFTLPLLDLSLLRGMYSSLSLYFQSFEFNASIYYLVRAMGFQAKGYNIIATAGPTLALIAGLGIFLIAHHAKRWSLAKVFIYSWSIYLIFATTVHPWYIIPLVAFSVVSGYFYPILWSFLVFFTYTGYGPDGFHENIGVVIVEYLAVFACAFWELFKGRLRFQEY